MHLMGLHLMGVCLTGLHFMGVHLIGVYLMGVHLTGVHLMGVYLMGVQLIGVYLTGVHLIDVYFSTSKKALGENLQIPHLTNGGRFVEIRVVIVPAECGLAASQLWSYQLNDTI